MFVKFMILCIFGRLLHLGGFGRMENTPTVFDDDLPTIQDFSKMIQNRDVSTFFQLLDFAPNSIKNIYQPKLRPDGHSVFKQ